MTSQLACCQLKFLNNNQVVSVHTDPPLCCFMSLKNELIELDYDLVRLSKIMCSVFSLLWVSPFLPANFRGLVFLPGYSLFWSFDFPNCINVVGVYCLLGISFTKNAPLPVDLLSFGPLFVSVQMRPLTSFLVLRITAEKFLELKLFVCCFAELIAGLLLFLHSIFPVFVLIPQ